MFSYEAPSTSTLALHHDGEELPQWHAANVIEQFAIATNEALFAVQELAVEAETSIEQIAEHFGIHHFGIHIMAKSLSDCKIVLTSDSHLEIHREGQQHPTRFKVERKQLLAA
ncbi:MAG: hypothetical protein WAW59_04390 [Patescibacteria group bacterium]